MHLQIDDDMNCRCEDGGSAPIVFVPKVDFKTLRDPSIIDAF